MKILAHILDYKPILLKATYVPQIVVYKHEKYKLVNSYYDIDHETTHCFYEL